MPREMIADLVAFLAVAREASFTRAAAQLSVSPSALSHTIRKLEERVGVRLLVRTTRSVSPTEAGERLLRNIGPHFDQIQTELEGLAALRDRPAGTVRLTTGSHAAETILMPAVTRVMSGYPEVNIEINVDPGFVDIVANRFDAGVRFGETVAKDMVAVRIGPDMRMAAVASPEYFAQRKQPHSPQELSTHNCINLRFPTLGGLYSWEFEKGSRAINVRVEGQFVVNNIDLARTAALSGAGIAYLPEDYVKSEIQARRLVRVLNSWCPPFAGYHLYYPSRRQHSAAFSVLIEALRYRSAR